MHTIKDTTGNPNNCATCDHKGDQQGGWCYMFRNAPAHPCSWHSMREVDDYMMREMWHEEMRRDAFGPKF